MVSHVQTTDAKSDHPYGLYGRNFQSIVSKYL